MYKEIQAILRKDPNEFSGKDVETIMRSNLFKEGGMINRDYRKKVKTDENVPEGEVETIPSLDTNGFGDMIGISGRTISEGVKDPDQPGVVGARKISSRTYKAIVAHTQNRLLKIKVAEYERMLSIQ